MALNNKSGTNELNGFAGRVGASGAAVLGVLAWYAIPDLRIDPATLKSLAQQHGLSDAPKPGNAADAFRRATTLTSRRAESSPKRYLIRPVVDTGDELVRHIVVERVDSRGETLSHDSLAELRFTKVLTRFTSRFLLPPTSGPGMPVDEDLEAKKIMAECDANYRAFRGNFTGPELTRFVGVQLDALSRVTVHPHGHVYFIPASYEAEVRKLESFVRALAPHIVAKETPLTFWTIPVPDVAAQREMVHYGFKSTMLTDLSKIAGQIAEMLEGKVANRTPRFVESKLREIAEAREKAKLYKKAVGVSVAEVDAMIELLNTQAGECSDRLAQAAG